MPRKKGTKNSRMTPEIRARVAALRRIGISVEAIRRIVALDFREPITEYAVRTCDPERRSATIDPAGARGVAGVQPGPDTPRCVDCGGFLPGHGSKLPAP